MNIEANEGWKIGELARQAGVSVDSIRFWEEKGLLPPAGRRASGYRIFPPATLERIRFLQRAKHFDFTLEEIRGLLELRESRGTSSHPVLDTVRCKIDELDTRIRELQHLRRDLEQLASCCDGHHPVEQCPILDHLSRCEGDCRHGLDHAS